MKCLFCCPMCAFQCCSVDCNLFAKLCDVCRIPCKPICGILLDCEGKCQAQCATLCSVSPEIPCKASGCELTLGVPALENLVGVWHLATDMYPMFLPSILFPCCCFPCPPGLGQDETFSSGSFAPGGPTETKKVKILEFACGNCTKCVLCAPHSALKMGICGFCMDPIFNGDLPFWFCKETRCVSVSVGTVKIGAA
jgi:hypothetical protein